MRHWIIRSAFLAAAACLAAIGAPPQPALAQSPPAIVVGVVDWDQIMRDSKAAKSIKQQLDKQKAVYQAELNKQEKALKEADQKLASARSTLSDADFKLKVQDLNQQADKLRQSFKQRQEQLDSTLRQGLDQVRRTLLQIVADIAKQRGLTLVLNKADVLLAHSAYDFTADAMEKLDAKLPAVKLAK